MSDWALIAALTMFAVAGLVSLVRLLRSEDLANGIVALDSVLVAIVSGLAVHAALTQEFAFLDVMVVTSLLGFTGTALVAQFIERRSR